jgi:hypothetical protein
MAGLSGVGLAGRAPRFWFDDARIGFRQKCHTESVSDSRLLREARMLHYGTTSRSARIVVTLLHESPGPTTAGASLFWTPRFSPGPPALISQSRRKILPRRKAHSVRHRSRCGRGRRRVVSPPAEALRCSPLRALPTVKSQRRRQTLLSIPRLDAAWEFDHQAWRPRTSPILSRGPKQQARYNAAVRHDKRGTSRQT